MRVHTHTHTHNSDRLDSVRILRALLMITGAVPGGSLVGADPTPTPCPVTPTPYCTTCVLTTPTYTPVASPSPVPTPSPVSLTGLPLNLTQTGTGQFANVQAAQMTANSAAIPTLNAGTITTRQILSTGAESKYASFGSRWYLKPRSEGLGLSFLFAPSPMHQSTTNYSYSGSSSFHNSWSPITTQAVYRDDMWDSNSNDRADYFAPHTIFMVGSITNTISNLETGDGKSRDDDWVSNGNFPYKYTVGTISQAQLVGPGTRDDLFSTVGAVNFAYTAFPKSTGTESGTGERLLYANFLSGAELGSFIGRWIGPDLSSGSNSGPMDGREAALKEDDLWAPAPAVANYMAGTTNQVWVDNKRVGFCVGDGTVGGEEEGADWGTNVAGKIGYAVGTRAAVLAALKKSWVNVDTARGVTASFALVETLETKANYFCGDERLGSRVGSWMGFESPSPTYDPCKTSVTTSTGAFLASMSPTTGGGSPVMAAAALGDGTTERATSHEAHASLITRGETILGDGAGDEMQNYDTDVLHVKDVIRLAPRTSPPSFSATTPPSERVGLLYFDIARNALRVSLAVGEPSGDRWGDAEVVWVDVATAEERISDEDLSGAKNPVVRSRDQIIEDTLIAGGAAAAGESLFLEPRASVIVTAPDLIDEASAIPVSFFLTGFQGRMPRVMWKRIGSGPNLEGSVEWQELRGGSVTSTDPALGVLSAQLPLAMSGTTGVPGRKGDIIQFILIHPVTGQTTGTSARL